MLKPFYIAVDFDGTLVENKFPSIGKIVPDAFEWLRAYQKEKARLILWTCRSDQFVRDAVQFCRKQDISFYGVNLSPGQDSWTNSPKVFSHATIDDCNACCPLTAFGNSLVVDWNIVGPAVWERLIAHNKRFS